MIWFLILLEIAFAGLGAFVNPWYLLGFAITLSFIIAFQHHHEKHMKKYYETLDAQNNKLDASICNAIELLKEWKTELKKDTDEVLRLKKELASKTK